MKKLMVSMMLVGAALCGIAQEKAATPAKAEATTAATAEAKPKKARPPFDRAKFEAQMKARMEQRKAKMTEILKKYGVAEDKVAACVEELMNVAKRPPRPPRPPKAKAPAAAVPEAAK